jgi:tetratricopeptide (TPR) repeat protein
LNVSTILEGSVRKSGDRVRVTVRLVKVDGEENLWSETYDRIVVDVFAVQDDITQLAVTSVREALLGEVIDPSLSGAVKADVLAAAKGRSGSAEAHRLYLQGSFLVDRHSLPEMPKGIDFLREAVVLDPGYALAWACLSRALALDAIYSHSPVDHVNTEARDAALRSLTLEPDLAEGLMALGVSKMFGAWDWAGADAAFRRALEIAPENADVLRTSGVLAHMLGRLEEALALSRRAMECDPLGISGFSHFARTCRSLGKMADAERAYRRALELSPQAAGFHMALAWTMLERGHADEALIEASLEPAPWARLCGESTVNYLLGRSVEADNAYRKLVEKYSFNSAFQIALVHAVRGEIDAAFEWLERSFAQREFGLSLLMAEPHFRRLHADGRWFGFLKRLGLLM